MSANPLTAFGAWLADTPADWPEAAWHSAHRQFIDVIGVSVPGAAEPVTRRVLATVRDWGKGFSTAILGGERLSAPWAALVNGTAAHALDYDDNFDPAKAHATAVLAPALLALAEQEGASGRACLDAYVAGLQILGRVGQGVNPVHRNRGWHATATVGAIGAAAACARLLKLDRDQAGHALSIATSLAGGFMSQFGTQTKPIHAGFAAKAGIIAASLARAGIDGGRATLDGPHGMNRLMVGPDYEMLRDSLAHVEHGQTLRFETERVGDPLLILSSGFRVKRFPNCGSAHRAMDGLAALIAEHGLTGAQVAEVEVRAPATHLANLMHVSPENGLQSKFSLEHGLAVLLAGRGAGLEDFTDAAVGDPQVRAFYSRIRRLAVDKAEGEFPTEVEVRLADGRTLSASIAMPVGSLAAPFSDAQVWAKFDQCVASWLEPARAAALRQALAEMRSLPRLDPLMEPLVASLPS